MDISKLRDFYTSHKSQTWHFLILSFIAFCCDFLLNHTQVPHYDTPFYYYLAKSYLILALGIPIVLSYITVFIIYIPLSIVTVLFSFVSHGLNAWNIFYILQTILQTAYSALFIWLLAGVFTRLRSKDNSAQNKRRMIYRIVLILFILLVPLFILWELGVFNVGEKPAVYLYPEKDMQVNVSVGVNGLIIKSIPEYNTGWRVYTTPDGRIDNRYDYLFYEVLLFQPEKPHAGWVVAYDELENWFDTKLPEMGLNSKESSDLKEYWLNRLPKSDYYQIGLLSESYLEKNMLLSVTPAPRTVIRRMLYFKPLKTKISLNEPAIETKERRGFTVVEWGGILDQSII